jgi:putative flippase GtrA
MVVYLGSTTLLADVAGFTFQLALAIGFGLAMAVHFTLQRLFVWAQPDEFALSLGHQAVRYVVLSGAQYAVTAASTAFLPGALGVDTEIVYFATVAVVVGTNFLVFRHGIFHPKQSRSPAAPTPPAVPRP